MGLLFGSKFRRLIISFILMFTMLTVDGQSNVDPFERMKILISSNLDSAQIVGEQVLSEKNLVDSIKAKACFYLGVIHYYKGQNYISADYYQLAITTRFAEGNNRFLTRCYNNLGIVLDQTEQYDLAIENYLKSMEIDMMLGDSAGVAQSKINIGLLYINMLQLDQAEEYLNEAKHYFERTIDRDGLALAYHNFAVLYKLRNMPDSSLMSLNKAAQLYSETGNQYEYVNVLIHLATNYQGHSNLDKATENILLAQKLADELGFEFFSSQAQLVYAGILLDTGDFEGAQEIIDHIETLNPHHEKDRRLLKLQLVNQTGTPQEFKDALNQYISYNDSVFVQDNNRIVNEINLKYKTEKRLAEIQTQKNIILNQRTALFLTFGVLIILIALLIIIILDRRKLRRSYEVIYRQLNEKSAKDPALREALGEVTEVMGENDALKLIWKRLHELMITEKPFLKAKVTIEEIANSCDTNKTYIYKAIKLFTNQTFNTYINSYRVSEARDLLQNNDSFDVNSIAKLSGFYAPSSFYRIFREHTGLTPSQYRIQARRAEKQRLSTPV